MSIKHFFNVALATSVTSLCVPCSAKVSISSELSSGFTRDEGVNQFSDEVVRTSIYADIGASGFSLTVANLTEVGNGDEGFEAGGGNANLYTVGYKEDKIGADEKYSWGAFAEYEDFLAKDADDEWSVGVWGQKKLCALLSLKLTLKRTIETASDSDPDGNSTITVSTPGEWTLRKDKLSIPFEVGMSYDEGPSRLEAAFIARGTASLKWSVNENLKWALIKLTGTGTVEHVHDERNGKFRTNYGTALTYVF